LRRDEPLSEGELNGLEAERGIPGAKQKGRKEQDLGAAKSGEARAGQVGRKEFIEELAVRRRGGRRSGGDRAAGFDRVDCRGGLRYYRGAKKSGRGSCGSPRRALEGVLSMVLLLAGGLVVWLVGMDGAKEEC